MIPKTIGLTCCECGKSISYEQAIVWHDVLRCLDCILWLLRSETIADETRVTVSVDLLSRLRDGAL